ncbi:hypothetical protein FJT64_001800 [Amphibalanus amphitrite]|uniref:BED-type domain-containing protein n=1 Tax=Amphibalanus amphitrite TaxID=1232801 RepID=A0A6A4X7T2_AMPAM|nr:hypothetical protein FJT64_001800 [Amphibalanus amphitrite]
MRRICTIEFESLWIGSARLRCAVAMLQPPPLVASGSKAKRSVVWEYFTMDADTMICKLCGKRLRGSDGLVPFNSSNFWKHLRRMHDIV